MYLSGSCINRRQIVAPCARASGQCFSTVAKREGTMVFLAIEVVVGPDAVLTSPLLRARETGNLLCEALDATPETDERLGPGATADGLREAVVREAAFAPCKQSPGKRERQREHRVLELNHLERQPDSS